MQTTMVEPGLAAPVVLNPAREVICKIAPRDVALVPRTGPVVLAVAKAPGELARAAVCKLLANREVRWRTVEESGTAGDLIPCWIQEGRDELELRLGSPVAAARLAAFVSDSERISYLQWRLQLLAAREPYKARTTATLVRSDGRPFEDVIDAADPASIESELSRLSPEAELVRNGDWVVYGVPGAAIPTTMREIGRLREVAFRAAGEGSGNPADLDEFDAHYTQLFVWNTRSRIVAGGYRLAAAGAVPELYTSRLFGYGEEFLRRLGPAVELGRSFVVPEFQRSFSPLLLLWKGIGQFLLRQPRYKVLFGAVSISADYRATALQLMVSFLEIYASLPDWRHLVRPSRPYRATATVPANGLDMEDLSAIVSDVEPDKPGVPVLLRQYLKLGGKLLAFQVDPDFAGVLDGLIVVDLRRTEPRLLERYLGAGWRAVAGKF